MFYHANWGDALRRLDAVHPSDDFLREVYPGFKRYAQYFDRERDDEASGLYDIDNHYETGQEYMHRYTAVNPDADRRHWGEVFRLKGVDVTVYVYELKRTLAYYCPAHRAPRRGRALGYRGRMDPLGGARPDVGPGRGDVLRRQSRHRTANQREGRHLFLPVSRGHDRPGAHPGTPKTHAEPEGVLDPFPRSLLKRRRPHVLGRTALEGKTHELPLERACLAHDE